MNWKDQLNDVAARLKTLERDVHTIRSLVLTNSAALGKMAEAVEALRKDRGRTIDRMSDRLIEMAMVTRGGYKDASLHRRSSQEHQAEEPNDIWQDRADSEWPPHGCDAVNLP